MSDAYEELRKARKGRRQRQASAQPGPNGGCPGLLPSPSNPMAVARLFVELHCEHEHVLTTRCWGGSWWTWRTTRWAEVAERSVRSLLYCFTENAVCYNAEGEPVPWAPTKRKIGDLLEALAAITLLPQDLAQPCWLDDRAGGQIVAVKNGLLDIDSRQLHPHTPLYFCTVSVPFAYDPEAPKPQGFLKFLDELWGDASAKKTVWANRDYDIPVEPTAEPPQQGANGRLYQRVMYDGHETFVPKDELREKPTPEADCLAEWFGYVISGRTNLQKMMLMIGPTRGGKGVLGRLLTRLLGSANVCGPTLSSFAGEFGLAPLFGKSLAIISDVRFAGKGANVVVERLLSISGEDTLTINRKYREQIDTKMSTRMHLMSNEMPRLTDASGAIIGRFVVLILTRSWLGKEDTGLEPKLCGELPGILNWALEGLTRLNKNDGHFTRVPSADEAIIAMRDLASPVAAFVRERCQIDPKLQTEVAEIYAVYKTWCEDSEYPKSSKHVFGRDLRAAFPSVRKERPRKEDGRRCHAYVGIGWRKGDEEEDSDDGEQSQKPLL